MGAQRANSAVHPTFTDDEFRDSIATDDAFRAFFGSATRTIIAVLAVFTAYSAVHATAGATMYSFFVEICGSRHMSHTQALNYI